MQTKTNDAIDEFIANHHENMTQRELADKCGISPSTVNRRLKALFLNGSIIPPNIARTEHRNKGEPDRDRDTMDRLIEVRDLLYEQLIHSSGTATVRISAEYRAVLQDIHELEEVDNNGKPSKLSGIFSELSDW